MTKGTSSGCTPLSIFYRCPRLIQGLSLMSTLGLLSSGLVVAQTETSSDPVAAPPAAVEAPPVVHLNEAAPPVRSRPREIAAPVQAPVPAFKPKPAAPETVIVPVVPVRKPAPAPAPVVRKPVPIARPQISRPAPAASTPKKPVLAAPNLSLPDRSTIAKPPSVIFNPAQTEQTANSPVDPSNSYIDRTDYSIGATQRYNAPNSVVLTERSTGCSAVAQNGQLSGGVCGGITPRQQTASLQKPGQQTADLQKPGQQTAGLQKPSQQTARQALATLVTLPEPQLNGVRRLPAPPLRGIQPVRVGPLRVSASGVRPTRQKAYSSYSGGGSSGGSGGGGTTPTGLAYYNLTNRPVGRPTIGKSSFMFPLSIPTSITSLFGWRLHPISGDYRFHAGTDLGAPQGTPVIAAASGEVATADFLGGYGLTVILRHEKGTQESRYAHLSEIFVQTGELVEQGTVIGRVGSTGNSTGPHLHFEWRHLTTEGWVAVDAGAHLEYALAQFINALQLAQGTPQRGF